MANGLSSRTSRRCGLSPVSLPASSVSFIPTILDPREVRNRSRTARPPPFYRVPQNSGRPIPFLMASDNLIDSSSFQAARKGKTRVTFARGEMAPPCPRFVRLLSELEGRRFDGPSVSRVLARFPLGFRTSTTNGHRVACRRSLFAHARTVAARLPAFSASILSSYLCFEKSPFPSQRVWLIAMTLSPRKVIEVFVSAA